MKCRDGMCRLCTVRVVFGRPAAHTLCRLRRWDAALYRLEPIPVYSDRVWRP